MPFYVLYEPANKHPQYFTLCKMKEKVVKTKSQMDQKLQNLLQILSPFFGQWDIQSNDTAIQGVIFNTKLKLSCNLMFFQLMSRYGFVLMVACKIQMSTHVFHVLMYISYAPRHTSSYQDPHCLSCISDC